MSQTQLSNINAIAGLIVLILTQFGVSGDAQKIAFIIAAAWSLGWTAYNYLQRYQKGDLTLGGLRKPRPLP